MRVGPLRRPAFARLWLSGLVSEIGDWLLLVALPVYVLQLTGSALVTSTVLFVVRRLGGGGAEVGLLRGVQAVGGIAGGLAVGWLAARLPPRLLVGAGLLGYAVVDAAIWNAPALTTALPLYLVLFAVVGLPIVATSSGLIAVVLGSTPDRFRGRVVSTHAGVFGILQAVGMLLAGLLAEPVGLLPLLNAQAAVAGVAGLVAVRMSAPPDERPVAPDHPPEDDARPVRPAVVGDQRVVPLQPPAAVDRPDRALDDEVVRAAREPADHEVPGPHPPGPPDQDCVPRPEGRHHRRADHEDPLPRPAG